MFLSRYLPKRSKIIIPDAPIKAIQLYNNCSDTPMIIFIKVNITKDLSHLIISGLPTHEQLSETWDKIKMEYADLSKDTSQSYLLNLMTNIDVLDKKLVIIQSIVDSLALKRNEEMIKILQEELLFPFQYEDLKTDLDKTILKAKFDLMQLRRLEGECKIFIEENKNNREITEQDYQDQFIALSKWMGVKYTMKNTSISEYIALVNRFNIENKPK